MNDRTLAGSSDRLPYHAPELREHGTVQEMTLAGATWGETYVIDNLANLSYADQTPPVCS